MTVEPFTPKAGMRCMMECGWTTEPLEPTEHGWIAYVIRWAGDVNNVCLTWTKDGSFRQDGKTSPRDIIAEAKPDEVAEESRRTQEMPPECAAIIARLEAENAKLKWQRDIRDAFIVQNDMLLKFTHQSGIEDAESELTTLRARVKELEAALEPFVPSYHDWMNKFEDDDQSSMYRETTFGQLRRAHAALSKSKG
jgi:hypothetical protein